MPESSEPLFYIRHSSGYNGDCVIWWRPNSAGYTFRLDEAGKYPESQARQLTQNRPELDHAHPCELVDRFAFRGFAASNLSDIGLWE